MAQLNFFTPANMATAQTWYGNVTGATASQITITDGVHTGIYSGQFTYAADGPHGLLTGYQAFTGTTLDWNATQLNFDAFTAFSLIQPNQVQAFYSLILNGADSFNGSSGADVFLSYGGNDTIRGGGGNDVIDGGTGIDVSVYSDAAKYFTVSASSGSSIVTVADRASQDGTDTLANIEGLTFAGVVSGIDPSRMVKAAQLGQQDFIDLTEMYTAYFNRAPDAWGLEYWASRRVEGMSLIDIAKSFFDQPETKATFPSSMTNEQFITQVYQNVLGRAPDQAGLNYWVNDLQHGVETRDMFMLAIIYGARAPTGSPVDAQYLANKEVVGAHFALDKGLGDVTWAQQVMQHVDATAQSVTNANAMTDAFAQQAVTTDPHLLMPLVGVAH